MGIWEKDPVQTVDFGRVLRINPKLTISESFSESFSEEEFNSIPIPKLILRMILRMIPKLGMAIELTSRAPEKSMQILLSRTQAEPGRAVKQQQ